MKHGYTEEEAAEKIDEILEKERLIKQEREEAIYTVVKIKRFLNKVRKVPKKILAKWLD